MLRPIVAEYQHAAERLARNPHGLAKRLAATAALRNQVNARMREVDDYMNWFEATQLPEPSGAFAGYLHATNTEELTSNRRDRISIYLNAMQAQVQ